MTPLVVTVKWWSQVYTQIRICTKIERVYICGSRRYLGQASPFDDTDVFTIINSPGIDVVCNLRLIDGGDGASKENKSSRISTHV
jgi:hypothetical protein